MSRAHISYAPAALVQLFKGCSRKRLLKKSDWITPYLETPKCLFMVLKGTLRVALSNSQNDGIVCIRHLKPGDVFGEQGLFASAPMQLATAAIQARSDVELVAVTHEDLKRAAQIDSRLYAELSTHINERLGETTDKLMQLVFDNLEQRCYQSLVEITRLPDAMTHPDGMQITVTRIELAQMIGCNRESAGKALKALRDKGMIEVTARTIVVYGIRHGLAVSVKRDEVMECV